MMNERSAARASEREELASGGSRVPWVPWSLTTVLGAVYALIGIHVFAIPDVTLATSTKALLLIFMLLPPPLCFVLVRIYTRMTDDERLKILWGDWESVPESRRDPALRRIVSAAAAIWYRLRGTSATPEGTDTDDRESLDSASRDIRGLVRLARRTVGPQRSAYTLPVFFFSFAYVGGLILMLPALDLYGAEVFFPPWTGVVLVIGRTTLTVPLIVLQAGFLGGAAYTALTITTRLLNEDITPRLFLVTGIRLMLAPLGALLLYLLAEMPGPTVQVSDSRGALFLYLVAGGFPVALLIKGAEHLCSRLKIGRRRRTAGNRSTTLVDGISIFVAQRLSEEGIDAIQHLAFCNVAELAQRTHYSRQTVADWKDQAVLYLLTGDCAVESQKAKLYDLLEAGGIRCMSALRRRVYDGGRVRRDLKDLFGQLGLLEGDQEQKPKVERLTLLFVGLCEDAAALAVDRCPRRTLNGLTVPAA